MHRLPADPQTNTEKIESWCVENGWEFIEWKDQQICSIQTGVLPPQILFSLLNPSICILNQPDWGS